MNTQTALTAKDVFISVMADKSDINAYTDLADCMSKKQITSLLEKAETNEWYWSVVTVRVEYMNEDCDEFTAQVYLGACSYKSRMDFIKTSGCYEDMLSEALEDLNSQIA